MRTPLGVVGTLEEVLYGPSHHVDGTRNIVGALKRARRTAVTWIEEFQKAEMYTRARNIGDNLGQSRVPLSAQEPSEHSLC